MPLQQTEIQPGVVAYFDAAALNADPDVSASGDPVTRTGAGNQFVCYRVDGDTSWWAPTTTQHRSERLQIDPAWVTFGNARLQAGDVYLQDGKNTYMGPSEPFVCAAAGEMSFARGRPVLNDDGIQAVIRVVRERGGQL